MPAWRGAKVLQLRRKRALGRGGVGLVAVAHTAAVRDQQEDLAQVAFLGQNVWTGQVWQDLLWLSCRWRGSSPVWLDPSCEWLFCHSQQDTRYYI